MKTLDEVITALDACQRSACEKCPYYDPNCDICDDVAQSDALHYLKEYQEISKAMNPKVYIPDGYKTAKLGDKNL